MVNLPPSSHDGAMDPVAWLFLLWPLFNPAKPSQLRAPPPHQPPTGTRINGQLALLAFLKWDQARSITPGLPSRTNRDWEFTGQEIPRQLVSLSPPISAQVYNKKPLPQKRNIYLVLDFCHIFSIFCFGFVTVSWQLAKNNNHRAAILTCDWFPADSLFHAAAVIKTRCSIPLKLV